MKMTDVAIDRPVFVTMVAVAAVVMGGIAYTRLGVDLFPDVSFPIATVVTAYPGAGPEEVENLVTRPIEEAVSSISGMDEVRSYSRDSVSTVVITFNLEANVQQAMSDVRDRVALIQGTLPRDVRDPIIGRVDPTAQAVLTYSVASPRPPVQTFEIADTVIRPTLERVPGVGSISIHGGAQREILVELDRSRLEAARMSVSQVAQAIGAQSFDVPGGRVTEGAREMSLKAVGQFERPEDVAEVVLASLPNGTQIRVGDVARVTDGTEEVRTLTRVNGVPAITFDVQKQAGTNTLQVVDAVEEAVSRLAERLPPDVEVTKVIDASVFVRNNMDNLQFELVLGGLLAVLVIFIFMLDWRSTLISAVALPTSVIATFFVMWQLGFTLNIMTMMALTLSIGMLIDDSVVVRENIFRHLELGEDPTTAARKGTNEIALAVMATTFTIVAVFGPVAFTGGLVGRMLLQFGLTVAVAVLVSLVVSFTLDPMLSTKIVQKIEPDHHQKMRQHRVFGPIVRGYEALDAFYRRVLQWVVSHRLTTVGIAAALFVASIGLTSLMGREFLGRGDQGELTINLELRAGTPLAQTDRMAAQIEEIVRAVPEVVTIATTVGPDEEVNKATLRVKTTPKDERERSLAQIMEELRPRLGAIPGLIYSIREAPLFGSAEAAVLQAPIVLYVRGPDYGELARIGRQAFEIARGTPGVRDLAMSYSPGAAEQRLVVDRSRAADLGVPFAALAGTLRTALEGEIVGQLREGEREADIRVRLQESDRGSLQRVLSLPVPSIKGETAYLSDVTRTEEAATPATIERLDRERQIAISANVAGRSLSDVIADLEGRLAKIDKGPAYTFRLAGEAEQMEETFSNLGIALLLAVLFIYLVLASQFESFVHPFTIMLSLPLAVVGALAALFLADLPIGMPAMIGIILLMGLVTKNAILLVDYANQLRHKRGLGPVEALLEAGPTRLRPILMTSAAIVLGMLPNAIGRGEGSELRAPMAIAVIGGVITSTFLTLVVVPVVYLWVDQVTTRRTAKADAPAGAADPGPTSTG